MNVYRGDIYYVDYVDYTVPFGSEQRPGRPAIVVSNNVSNAQLNTVQVVYLTSQDKTPGPTRTRVMCKVPSTALCEQLTTVDQQRLGTYVRTCTAEEMAEIDKCIMNTLGLRGGADKEIAELRVRLNKAEKELETANETSNAPNMDMLKLKAERDTYKEMCEKLLATITK